MFDVLITVWSEKNQLSPHQKEIIVLLTIMIITFEMFL